MCICIVPFAKQAEASMCVLACVWVFLMQLAASVFTMRDGHSGASMTVYDSRDIGF